jgi:hypothetical protein
MEPIVSLLGPLWLSLADRRPGTAKAMDRAQRRILQRLLAMHSRTEIGKRSGLPELGYEDFRRKVPVSRYADIEDLVERIRRGESDLLFPGKAIALAQTSGTTSSLRAGERYIPQSRELLAHHSKGGVSALSRLVQTSGPSVLGGGLLMLGGSSALERNPWGMAEGDLSGIMAQRIPALLRRVYEPGLEISLESDWKYKIERIARRCAGRDIRLVSGIASWLHVLFEVVCREAGAERLDQVWNLKGVIHGGAPITPSLGMLSRHLAPSQWMMEVYPASEGFIAVGSRPWRLEEGNPPALEVLSDHGIFLEFLPEGEEPDRAVGPSGLEKGGLYRVLVTTPGGLVRYELGDLVQGEGPGLLRIAGRLKARLSAFGEHVEGMQITKAIEVACRDHEASVAEYHVAPLFPEPGESAGRHEWWIEFDRLPSDPHAFLKTLDLTLCDQVIDYKAHRRGDLQLAFPVIRVLPPGSFHRVLERLGKLGGQHKIPQAASDRALAEQLQGVLS